LLMAFSIFVVNLYALIKGITYYFICFIKNTLLNLREGFLFSNLLPGES